MGRTKSVSFTDDGKSVQIYVDGEELQNVTSVIIEREAGFPSSVTVTQKFFPENLSFHIEKAVTSVKEEGVEDGQT